MAVQIVRIPDGGDVAPFFAALTVPSGEQVTVSFPAPAALGTYVVTAYAASASSRTVSTATASVTVAGDGLLLTPTVPAVLRAGDAASVGVLVTFSGPRSRLPVSVDITANDSAGILDGIAATVELTEGKSTGEARFPFAAPAAVGVVNVTFQASGDGAVPGDAVAVQIEVVPALALITRGSAVVVEGGNTVEQGLDLPEADAGTVAVTASAGHLASLHLLAQRLLDSVPHRGFSATWMLASVGLHAGLAVYGDAAFSAPLTVSASAASQLGLDTTDDGSVHACDALTAAWQYTQAAVLNLTVSNYVGLISDGQGSYPGWLPPDRPDAFLNLAVRPHSSFQQRGLIGHNVPL